MGTCDTAAQYTYHAGDRFGSVDYLQVRPSSILSVWNGQRELQERIQRGGYNFVVCEINKVGILSHKYVHVAVNVGMVPAFRVLGRFDHLNDCFILVLSRTGYRYPMIVRM